MMLHLSEQLLHARECLENYLDPEKNHKIGKEKQIPDSILKNAAGIAIFRVLKATAGIGGQIGDGVIIGRNFVESGWSGPVSVRMIGAEIGFAVGVSTVDHILVFRDPVSFSIFVENGQMKLGGDANVTVGPIGREAAIGVDFNKDASGATGIYAYSMSTSGLYLGISLEGQLIKINYDALQEFYGKSVKIDEIVQGKIKVPEDNNYKRIIQLLDQYTKDSTDISTEKTQNKTWNLPQSKQFMWDKLKNTNQYKNKEQLNEAIEPKRNTFHHAPYNRNKSIGDVLHEGKMRDEVREATIESASSSASLTASLMSHVPEINNTLTNNNNNNTFIKNDDKNENQMLNHQNYGNKDE